ncbi:MAG: GNAT family N-acetyltransferase [Ignavibacteriales bacterium]|nr:GNAT family N-acetyltransferase [Ignavibacteriales bacterium]
MQKVLHTIDSLLTSSPLSINVDSDTQIRVLQMHDAEQLFAATEQNREHLRAWLPWVDSNQTLLDTKRFIHTIVEQFKANEGFQCGIWHKESFAGVVGFHKIDWMNKNVEIGYWLGKDFEGKGLMTKSCKVLVDYAFHESKLKRVQIRCATGNTKSCRIPERLGFRKEGIALRAEYLYGHFVDLVIYGMTDSEWKLINGGVIAEVILAGANPSDVESIDSMVGALYGCMTFAPRSKPDYARLRSLCHFNAKFIPAKTPQERSVAVLHTEEFIARSDRFVEESEFKGKGFYEREIGRKTEFFGNIAHVFSAYESRFSKSDVAPIARGINSIQLVRDHGRWWILSVAWESERPDNPMPHHLLS